MMMGEEGGEGGAKEHDLVSFLHFHVCLPFLSGFLGVSEKARIPSGPTQKAPTSATLFFSSSFLSLRLTATSYPPSPPNHSLSAPRHSSASYGVHADAELSDRCTIPGVWPDGSRGTSTTTTDPCMLAAHLKGTNCAE